MQFSPELMGYQTPFRLGQFIGHQGEEVSAHGGMRCDDFFFK